MQPIHVLLCLYSHLLPEKGSYGHLHYLTSGRRSSLSIISTNEGQAGKECTGKFTITANLHSKSKTLTRKKIESRLRAAYSVERDHAELGGTASRGSEAKFTQSEKYNPSLWNEVFFFSRKACPFSFYPSFDHHLH